LSHLRQGLPDIYPQRCVFHTWRNLGPELSRQAAHVAQGLEGQEAHAARERLRGELTGRVHGVLDAPCSEEAEEALARLHAHPQGQGLWKVLNARFIPLLTHTMVDHQGLGRVTPEWMWRDFRLRLGRGRNHGSEKRLQRAGLVFTILRHSMPTQLHPDADAPGALPAPSASWTVCPGGGGDGPAGRQLPGCAGGVAQWPPRAEAPAPDKRLPSLPHGR
jgi:hypothetical protein